MLSSLSAPIDAALAPPPERERIAFLRTQPFAHRGFHGRGVVENSRDAFNRAIALGHGIELDVQGAQGGEAFVFHDDNLERLTGERGPVGERLAYELDHMHLLGSHETIPRLAEIMALIAGRVPVLIEVKAKTRAVTALCLSVRRALEGYRGRHAIMSFNPEVCHWFHEHSRRTTRGLVITEGNGEARRGLGLAARFSRHGALWRAKPDFLAYDIRDLPSRFAQAQRERGLGLVTWTVRSAEQERIALAHADEMIYEQS